MNKHTPGPWIVDEPHQVYAEAVHEYVAITQVEDWETVPREQVEANARLIAAAPDLLEALTLMIAECYDQERDDAIIKAVAKARAAIAKAEGQQ